ncbi:MAG: DUF128 domain-containing protein [Candidatus Altiarchaeota archaeon]|nr:DUF128 domain-containing protein [Candidatus Altiarchaeota archaeon]
MTKEKNVFEILSALDRANKPMTSGEIRDELHDIGIDLTERMVRNYMESLDGMGFTRKLGRSGRQINELGREELKKAYIFGRSDFILDRIVRLITDTRFDLERGKGDVIVNLSFIQEDQEDETIKTLKEICDGINLTPPFIKTARQGDNLCNREVPEGMFGLATISSVTIEEVLLNERIYVNPLYGGLIEFLEHKPKRFTELISYEGSSIDPLQIFISNRMGSVYEAVKKNLGGIPADYREIPSTARLRALKVLKEFVDVFGGLVVIGRTGSEVLGLKTKEGYTGIVGFGGELLLSALEERNIKTNTTTVEASMDFNELQPIAELRGGLLLY